MLKRFVASMSAVLFTFAQVQASEVRCTSWNLNKIVRYALENTPELKALDKDVQSQQFRADQAGKWENPEIQIMGGPMLSTPNGAAVDITFTQKVPLFGKKAIDEKIGKQSRFIAERDSAIGKLRVQHEVVQLAYRLAAAVEQSKHISHRRERIQLISKFLTTRPFASPSQWVEKNLVQNRLREVEEKFLEISAEKEKAWSSLNIYLGLSEMINPNLKWFVEPVEPDYEKLLKRLSNENPELVRQRAVISSFDLNIEQAEKKGYPDFRFGLGYNEQSAGVSQRIYTGAIQFTLPFLDRGTAARQSSQVQKEAETYRWEQKYRIVMNSFFQAKNDLNTSRNRIGLYPLKLVAVLEEQMNRTELEWKKGLVPVVAFLEMENQAHEHAVKVFDAQADYASALSKIQFLVGQNFIEGNE